MENCEKGNLTLVDDGEKETDEFKNRIDNLQTKLNFETNRADELGNNLAVQITELTACKNREGELKTENEILKSKLDESEKSVDILRAQNLEYYKRSADFISAEKQLSPITEVAAEVESQPG